MKHIEEGRKTKTDWNNVSPRILLSWSTMESGVEQWYKKSVQYHQFQNILFKVASINNVTYFN